ncbi:LysM peptidoglycan-binding domain-containing protein [Siminovitchia acidinfaciens]|uniref:LysM peptidoglycan-binding domain-containing protein n=1 Tax=Siminovitchia acidinfaciens TaxID=2321395 RepID=UPI001F46F085|nr:LysM domain-containing protein [Siminovitchia acidinfaciens]
MNYITRVKKTLKGYKVGMYGSYTVMHAVKGQVDYYWQTYAWSGGKVADFNHMHQYHNDIVMAGVAIDRNSIKKSPGHWGSVQAQIKPVVRPVANPSPKTAASTGGIYTVKKGDVLSKIAARYKTTVAEFVRINGIKNPNLIYPGQKINLSGSAAPAKSPTQKPVYHTVNCGDVVSRLAIKYGST